MSLLGRACGPVSRDPFLGRIDRRIDYDAARCENVVVEIDLGWARERVGLSMAGHERALTWRASSACCLMMVASCASRTRVRLVIV